ncbi:hypothetical protein C9I57_09190 [Trinickia symbiotica]|uniref:Uncharacterized protein n=1 Tax=Trinickia symbiotica TaxID=863227 RepID=A0A2T3XWL7_9BURK|nr:hypothetical protein C9I57_09190 [Trinickia symbiotica]
MAVSIESGRCRKVNVRAPNGRLAQRSETDFETALLTPFCQQDVRRGDGVGRRTGRVILPFVRTA